MNDYERIEKAIVYLKQNFKEQPDLDEVAKQVYLSPFHFQRLFKEWAGVSPKKFLQFISVEYANDLRKVKLHLKGTPFQIKVWQSLLRIPFGNISTYSGIAENIQSPNASRAVGTAIGNNPVAFLIPCHRVIKSSGIIGDYHWGSN